MTDNQTSRDLRKPMTTQDGSAQTAATAQAQTMDTLVGKSEFAWGSSSLEGQDLGAPQLQASSSKMSDSQTEVAPADAKQMAFSEATQDPWKWGLEDVSVAQLQPIVPSQWEGIKDPTGPKWELPCNDEIFGTSFDDQLYGDHCKNVIWAYSGADLVRARGRADTVYGGSGEDTIYGGWGRDALYGDEGHDILYGGLGRDLIHGGEGTDIMYGGAQSDTIYAGPNTEEGASADEVYGGHGDDHLYTAANNTVIYGGSGNDDLTGLVGTLDGHGGSGDDSVRAGTASDRIIAGSGNDTVYGLGGGDSVEGQSGDDYIKISGPSPTDHLEGRAYGGDGNDTIVSGEFADGGSGDDSLQAFTTYGGAGHDTLTVNGFDGENGAYGSGGEGSDKFHVGFGTAEGGAGSDLFVVEGSHNVNAEAYGGDAADFFEIDHSGDVQASGGDGNDIMMIHNMGSGYAHGADGHDFIRDFTEQVSNNSTILGGAGNDTLTSYGTKIYGGSGDDDIVYTTEDSPFQAFVQGDGGADNMQVTSDYLDSVVGGSGDDVMDIDINYAFQITGGDGDDAISLSDRTDVEQLFAGAGADTLMLEGNARVYSLEAGSGDDDIEFTTMFDAVFGQDGDDVFRLGTLTQPGSQAWVYGGDGGQDTLEIAPFDNITSLEHDTDTGNGQVTFDDGSMVEFFGIETVAQAPGLSDTAPPQLGAAASDGLTFWNSLPTVPAAPEDDPEDLQDDDVMGDLML